MKQPPLSGRYELEEIVGTGGMSVVYRAWDLKYDREVAVKVLRPEYVADEVFIRQFSHEAQAASQMSHPNIVNMFDVGQDGETRYIVMEYVKGITLKEMIRQCGQIKPQRAVQMTLKILAAIDHAHKNHIVHRDIKPQNILVDSEGHVKVADFGIARVVDSSASTVGRNVLGSVHYFSPEQASGAVADEKSDLYSVGVVFYEMVTGRVPFDGETPMAIALKHIHEQPVPASTYNPDISKGLDEVILKALDKDASKRYQSPADMAIDLKRALKMPMGGFIRHMPDQAGAATAPEEKKRRSWRWLLIAVAVLALCTGSYKGWEFYQKLQTRVRVPSVVLNDVEDTLARLEQLGLSCVIDERYDDEVVAGVVIAQSPESGSLLYPGDEVRLEVSLGRESEIVPDVTNMTRSEALVRLEESGLEVGEITLEISDEVAVGSVIRQFPEAGSVVQPFAEISLIISGETTLMPDLSGLTVDLARATLAASGLQLGVVSQCESDEEKGTVIDQSRVPGERILWGEKVDVTISETDELLCTLEVPVELTIRDNGTVVYAVLSDGETDREVYRSTLNAGTQEITIHLDSGKSGPQTLRVYVGGQLAQEKSVTFEQN